VTIELNGETRELPESIATLSDLFDFLSLSPKLKVVEINGSLYKEDDFSSVRLKSGDTIEIVQFMGGGL